VLFRSNNFGGFLIFFFHRFRWTSGKSVKMCTRIKMDAYFQWLQADSKLTFELVAVVVHIGQSASRGHYITAEKRGSKWLCLDDIKVSIQLTNSEVVCYVLILPVCLLIIEYLRRTFIVTCLLCKTSCVH